MPALVVYSSKNVMFPKILGKGRVRIVAVAREAIPPSPRSGPRTKVAVDSIEREWSPVGAAIGAALGNPAGGQRNFARKDRRDPLVCLIQAQYLPTH